MMSWSSSQRRTPGTHPDELLLAAWEQLAARGVIVEFTGEPVRAGEGPAEDLVTIATFRNHVQAQFAQTRLLASGIQAFLFDDNTIRINWFWSTALGGVKLRVPIGDAAESLEILRHR
jgi:hypothetical protein